MGGGAAIIGSILTLEYRLGNYYFNVAILMVPIIIIGRKCKEHFDCLEQRIAGWWFVPIGVVLWLLNRYTGLEVGLSRGEIYGGLLFYSVSILGIIWCLSLSKLINTLWLNKAMAYIGRNSMYLMIWHGVSFKLLDGLIGRMTNSCSENLRYYPIAFSSYKMRLEYCVIGIVLPLLIGYTENKVFSWLQRIVRRK